jgi:fatty-acyl-CoA synthase
MTFGIDESSVYLSPAPLYHAAPLRVSCLVHCVGGTVVVMEKFDAEAALAAIERYRVTTSQWVPTMFVRMLKLDPRRRSRYDLSSMRTAVHAAAPCPAEVKEQMIDWWGPIIGEYYAGTENFGLTMISAAEWLAHKGSVGRPVGCAVHICGDDGRELPPGDVGVVYFEKPCGGFSYHNAPDKTAGVCHPARPGWRTLGDVGYADPEGYLYLTDRKAFMIVSGGVNVYPQEVENVLVTHPQVADAAVFGVPDPDLVEAVKAVVEPLAWDDAGPDLADRLMTYCRQRLAGYKCPRSLDFERELPRRDNGSPTRRRCATATSAGRHWSRP